MIYLGLFDSKPLTMCLIGSLCEIGECVGERGCSADNVQNVAEKEAGCWRPVAISIIPDTDHVVDT